MNSGNWFFFLVIAALVGVPLTAQQSSGEVTYRYAQKLRNVNLERTAVLRFAGDQSVFYHSRGSGIVAVDIDGRVGGPDMTYTTGPEHDGSPVIDFYRQDAWGNTYFLDFAEDRLLAREMVYMRPYSYEEPRIPQLDWKLLDTSRIIGQYVCLGASTHFRGRDYLAWYTPEVPLPYGPWKLQGLPGLILTVSDAENRIVFEAITIRTDLSAAQRTEGIRPADKANRDISFEEFKEVYRREQLRLLRQASSTADREEEQTEIKRIPTVEVFKDRDS